MKDTKGGIRFAFTGMIILITFFGFTGCRKQKQNEVAKTQGSSDARLDAEEDYPVIEPLKPYLFSIRFHRNSREQFTLWFPEVAIFNSDAARAETVGPAENILYEKNRQGYLVSGSMGLDDQRLAFRYEIWPVSEEEISIELEIKNTGKLPWNNYAQLAVCLAPGDSAFSDRTGDWTFVDAGKSSVQSIRETGLVKDFNHYPVKPRNDSSDTEQRFLVTSGFVARTSVDGQKNVSFYWDKSARVDVNPGGLDCIHSHPAIGPLKPGEKVVRKGYIVLKRGRVNYNPQHIRHWE